MSSADVPTIPAAEPVPDDLEVTLRVGALAGGGYRAEIKREGDLIGEGEDRDSGQVAAMNALRDTIDLVRMRPLSSRRGPDVLVLLTAQDAIWWPQSNLNRDGCKHSIFTGEGDRIRAGLPTRCAKCQAVMLAIVEVDEPRRALLHLRELTPGDVYVLPYRGALEEGPVWHGPRPGVLLEVVSQGPEKAYVRAVGSSDPIGSSVNLNVSEGTRVVRVGTLGRNP